MKEEIKWVDMSLSNKDKEYIEWVEHIRKVCEEYCISCLCIPKQYLNNQKN